MKRQRAVYEKNPRLTPFEPGGETRMSAENRLEGVSPWKEKRGNASKGKRKVVAPKIPGVAPRAR